MVAVGALIAVGVGLLPPLVAPAAAAPGNPGVPGDPAVVFEEDFENAPTDPQLVDGYVGAAPLAMTYGADSGWLTGCNGHVMRFAHTTAPLDWLCTPATWDLQRIMAAALGQWGGATDPEANNVVGAFTGTAPPAGSVQLETLAPILVTPNRFYTFSVDAGAVNCGASAPLHAFYLVDEDDQEQALFAAPINVCAAPDMVIDGVSVGTFAADTALLYSGTELRVRLRNANGSAAGNDGVIDNIRVLDATPQLDKELTPAVAPVGVPVDLVFTITNTSELAAKAGWSFTDNLPAGLSVIDPTAGTTTCTNGDVVVTGDAIAVSGDLTAGQVSCTASIPVRFTTAGTYVNDASNISDPVGISPPGPTQVTSTDLPTFACSTTAFLSQGAPSNLYEVDVISGSNEIVAPAFYPENINAIGYNPLDDYIYGWITSGPEPERGIARIGADHTVEHLGYPLNWDDFDLGPSHHIGDFDSNGHLWLSSGVGGYWVQIDLAPGSPTYLEVLDTGPLTAPLAGYSFADWGFNPQDGLLYTTVSGPGNNKRLWSFDRVTELLSDRADLGNIVDGAFGGALYTDANNNLFTSNNVSGEIWHVKLPAGPASFLADGPIAPTNDGAICFNTVIQPLGPVIDLTKTSGTPGAVTPGGTVSYTVSVTNAGNLSGFDVLVEDPLPAGIESGTWTCAGAACPAPSGPMPLSETIAELGIGASVEYTVDAVVAEDPPAEITNVATVTGPEITCAGGILAPCEATVVNPTLPIVTVVKTADVEITDPGATVTYEIVVTNVGQGALDGDLVVSDPLAVGLASGTWTCAAAGGATCPAVTGEMPLAEAVTELPAGASVVYTVAAVVGEAPPARVENVASVDGPVMCRINPLTAPPCTASAVVELADPSLDLLKTATVEGEGGQVAEVGDTILYGFVVRNTGNVTLTDVTVDDPMPGLSAVVCPDDELDPGEDMTCNATYTVREADRDAGVLVNTATAMGESASSGAGVLSAAAEVSVTVASGGLGALPRTGLDPQTALLAAFALIGLGLLALGTPGRAGAGAGAWCTATWVSQRATRLGDPVRADRAPFRRSRPAGPDQHGRRRRWLVFRPRPPS